MKKALKAVLPVLLILLLLFVSPVFVGETHAVGAEVSVTMPAVYANGMVLQREKEICILGYSENEGATLRVELGELTETATVKDGEWSATFPPMPATFGTTLKIFDSLGNLLKSFSDVNIGEVWVVSGQSNAQLQSGHLEDVEEYSELSKNYSNIRLYKSSSDFCLTEDKIGSGRWYDVDSSVIKSTSIMSAVGYTTVEKLAAELGPDIPVALIHVARGSSKIITWVDYEAVSRLSPSKAKEYLDYVAEGTLPDNAYSTGAVGTVLYNKQIAPLRGYAVRGVMWYQGCGDTGGEYFGDEGATYTDYFTALVGVYRRIFGGDDDLPFYVMQLAPFISSSYGDSAVWEFKCEQYSMCKAINNAYLVSLATDGSAFTMQDKEAGMFIHPAKKSTVGLRCANMILDNEYGIKVNEVYDYPKPISATYSGGKVTVTFDTELSLLYGNGVQGFEVFNGSAWVKMSGQISGNTVELTGAGLGGKAYMIRYGCGLPELELGDGRVVQVCKTSSYVFSEDGNFYTVTDVNGKTYEIRVDSTDHIRTREPGNITNDSGVPLVVFSMGIVTG